MIAPVVQPGPLREVILADPVDGNLGFSFYQVIASAFIFIFAKVLLALLGVIGPISLSNAFTVMPALIVTLFVCIFGLFKIPELTGAILSGRTGTWVNPLG